MLCATGSASAFVSVSFPLLLEHWQSQWHTRQGCGLTTSLITVFCPTQSPKICSTLVIGVRPCFTEFDTSGWVALSRCCVPLALPVHLFRSLSHCYSNTGRASGTQASGIRNVFHCKTVSITFSVSSDTITSLPFVEIPLYGFVLGVRSCMPPEDR